MQQQRAAILKMDMDDGVLVFIGAIILFIAVLSGILIEYAYAETQDQTTALRFGYIITPSIDETVECSAATPASVDQGNLISSKTYNYIKNCNLFYWTGTTKTTAPSFASLASGTYKISISKPNRFVDTPLPDVCRFMIYGSSSATARSTEWSTLWDLSHTANHNPLLRLDTSGSTCVAEYNPQNWNLEGSPQTITKPIPATVIPYLEELIHRGSYIYVVTSAQPGVSAPNTNYYVANVRGTSSLGLGITTTWNTTTNVNVIAPDGIGLRDSSSTHQRCGDGTHEITTTTTVLTSGSSSCAVTVLRVPVSIQPTHNAYGVSLKFTVGTIDNPLGCDILLWNSAPTNFATQYQQAYTIEDSAESVADDMPNVIAWNSDACKTSGEKTVLIQKTSTLNLLGDYLRDATQTKYPYITIAYHESDFNGDIHFTSITDYELDVITDVVSVGVPDIGIVQEASDTEIVLNWNDPPLNGATLNGYKLYYGLTKGAEPDELLYSGSGNDYTHTGLDPARIYNYLLVASSTYDGLTVDVKSNVLRASPTSKINFGSIPTLTAPGSIEGLPIIIKGTETGDTAVITMNWATAGGTPSCYYTLTSDPVTRHTLSTAGAAGLDGRLIKTWEFTGRTSGGVDISCAAGGYDVSYAIKQDNTELLKLFQQFRDGTYGTVGQFGGLDLITYGIILVTMLGFSRKNETIGVVTSIVIVGFMAWMELIIFPSVVLSLIMVILIFTIVGNRIKT